MSTTILPKSFRVDGVLTDMTSVSVDRVAGVWGVRRQDTGATVVAAGTAMVHDGVGMYSLAWTDPAAGLTYDYSVKLVYLGVTYYVTGTITGSAAVYDAATGAFVEQQCCIRLAPSIEQEIVIGTLPRWLCWGPLYAAPTITELTTGKVLVDTEDFIWTERGRIIELGTRRQGTWQIDYVAGYVTVPAALTALLATLAPMVAQSGGYQSETLGDYSYTLASGQSASTGALGALDLYRRVIT